MFRELKLLKLIYQYHIEESEVRYEHVKGEVDDLEKKFKKVNEKVDAEDDDRRRRLCSMETPKKTKVSFPRFRGKNFEDLNEIKAEVEDGFKTNQIKKKEQVQMLKKCLKENPVKLKVKQKKDAILKLEEMPDDKLRGKKDFIA